ncbi:UNVERIFIED_CONTAM: hypothetical protein Sradi_4516900 [Sesamum radiatum]|uniref:Uncharacterized protein n=1 Tax=Sesamum radiatum TaxID=300843 RepID=A0AAW2NC52_SESRA
MGSPLASAGSAQLPKHAEGARCPPRSGRRCSAGISTARALAAASIRADPRPEPIGGPASGAKPEETLVEARSDTDVQIVRLTWV